MNPQDAHSVTEAAIRDAAARWVICRDRGMSANESIEFELWLAADPRHAAAMERSAGLWSSLDVIPEDLALETLDAARQRRQRRRHFVLVGTIAASLALIAGGVWGWHRSPSEVTESSSLVAAGPRTLTLADGSVVRMNTDSEVIEAFTEAERTVRLTRGEAHFTVTKNAARPFVVIAGATRVRAVGTAFNVNLKSERTEVLVTEGVVKVISKGAKTSDEPMVEAGHRAVVKTLAEPEEGAPPSIEVTAVDAAEISRALAWHDSLLRLGGATLAELVVEFERRTGQRVVITDPSIAALRFGGRFRSDDPEGFVGLLSATFNVEVERRADGVWYLRKKVENRDNGK